MGETESHLPAPRRTWRRRIVWAALVCVAALLVVVIVFSSGVQREFRAIRVANEPLTDEDVRHMDREGRVRKELPDAATIPAAVKYRQAFAVMCGREKGLDDYYAPQPSDDLSTSDVGLLQPRVKAQAQALELMRQAGELGGIAQAATTDVWNGPVINSDLAVLRSAARLLEAASRVAESWKKPAEAMACVVDLLRLARTFPGESNVSGLLSAEASGIACRQAERCLRMEDIPPESLAALCDALRDMQEDHPAARLLCGERLILQQYILDRRTDKEIWITPPPVEQRLAHHFGKPVRIWRMLPELLPLLRESIAAARMPFPQSLDSAPRVRPRQGATIMTLPGGDLTGWLAPEIQSVLEETARAQAQIRVTLVGAAVKLYAAEKGKLPETLQELVPARPAAVPTDPFSGKPLLFRVEEGNAVIYSVGSDRIDNNGTGTLKGDSKDIVIRVKP